MKKKVLNLLKLNLSLIIITLVISCVSIGYAAIQTKININGYAKIVANLFTVLFEANGGTVSPSSKVVAYSGEYGELPVPVKTGYNFNGWYTAATDGSLITDKSVVSKNSNHTLYARWAANNYTLTFNANGGSVSTTSKSITYDSTYGTLPTPTRTGYNFIGWFNNQGSNNNSAQSYKDYAMNYYADKNEDLYNAYGYDQAKLYNHWSKYGIGEGRRASQYLSTDIVNLTSNKTVYAGWYPKTFAVSYNANGGSGSMSAQTATYGKAFSIAANSFTRSGYTFAGWTTNSNGTDDGYGWTSWSGTWNYLNGQYGISGDALKLYARWKGQPDIGFGDVNTWGEGNNSGEKNIGSRDLTGYTRVLCSAYLERGSESGTNPWIDFKIDGKVIATLQGEREQSVWVNISKPGMHTLSVEWYGDNATAHLNVKMHFE